MTILRMTLSSDHTLMQAAKVALKALLGAADEAEAEARAQRRACDLELHLLLLLYDLQ